LVNIVYYSFVVKIVVIIVIDGMDDSITLEAVIAPYRALSNTTAQVSEFPPIIEACAAL